jgi:repressor LexA
MPNNITEKDAKALSLIRNSLVHKGVAPSLREINKVTGDKSPRSASLVIERLTDEGYLKKVGRKIKLTVSGTVVSNSINTVNVPLVGTVPCGAPLLAEENIETNIQVSTSLAKPGYDYFLLRAEGTSMNQAGISPGDILLVRQQPTAENGDKVVALINDEATVKIFEKKGDVVVLKPKSSDPHKPIILTDECIIQGVVVAVLPSNIY